MPKGCGARRKRRGKGKKKKRRNATRNKHDVRLDRALESTRCSAVSRVLDNVVLADAIMSYCFVAKKNGFTKISPLAKTSMYWYSCHEDFVARDPQALLRRWFELCCDSKGLFEHNRTEKAKRLHERLVDSGTQLGEAEILFLRGSNAKCFCGGDENDSDVHSNVHIMSLLNILSNEAMRTNTMVVSFVRHLMSQWMFLSIGDWRSEMKDAEAFKKNLMEMCVGWEKARRGGCGPAGVALRRARMLYRLAVAFETKDARRAQRIVNRLKL